MQAHALLCDVNDRLVLNPSRGSENDAWCRVVLVDVVAQVLLRDRLDVLERAQDRVSQRVSLECRRMEVVKDHFLWLVIHFVILADDHAAPAFVSATEQAK